MPHRECNSLGISPHHSAAPVSRQRPLEGSVGVEVDVLEQLVVHVLVHEGTLDPVVIGSRYLVLASTGRARNTSRSR